MRVNLISIKGTWRSVANAARTTIRMESGMGQPSSRWKKKLLLSEHSPIRKLAVEWKWYNLMSWVSVHMVRHKYGIEHFVSTQRSDRTKQNRNEATQDALVVHECEANAQAMISISRKRLCSAASKETIEAWAAVLEKIRETEPELYSVCVPECVYRGFCPEIKKCGYSETKIYAEALKEYRKV